VCCTPRARVPHSSPHTPQSVTRHPHLTPRTLLSPLSQAALPTYFTGQLFDKGTVLFEATTASDRLFLIEHGTVSIVIPPASQKVSRLLEYPYRGLVSTLSFETSVEKQAQNRLSQSPAGSRFGRLAS
jgi:hypothetical protein